MPNKDWYWDRFETTIKQGELDLSDAQTKAITDNKKFTDQQAVNYETKWIDELYGTDDRAWAGDKAPYDDGTYGGVLGDDAENMFRDIDGYKSESVTWGLDLVRDWTGKEDLEVGSDEHFEWQTRGKVAWDKYYNDNAYQKAFKDYKKERDSGVASDYSTLEDFLTDRGRDAATTEGRIDFLDWAKDHQSKESDKGKEALRDTWDNQYVDQFDPETATPYVATYLDIPDLWGQAKAGADWETPDTPISVVKPASIPTLDNIKRTQVKVPDSIKNWGEAKSAPTHSFKPGGGEN
tara:strand:+ start:338 stop:1216 length:879 start_codon:yes stop_codon:yes gene_type:complete